MNMNIATIKDINDIYKMKKVVRRQKEAVVQEKGLATFYGGQCPEHIILREKSLEDIENRLNDMLSNMDMAD
jgi:hypothetical protein